MLMGLKSTRLVTGLAAIGLVLGAVMALRTVQQPSSPAWLGSIAANPESRHYHPRMDGDTLLAITPTEGQFATRMHAWFPLYDRLEARGLVEIERHEGMYVVRRLANCPATVEDDAHMRVHRCG
jgi:hypothetical protein